MHQSYRSAFTKCDKITRDKVDKGIVTTINLTIPVL